MWEKSHETFVEYAHHNLETYQFRHLEDSYFTYVIDLLLLLFVILKIYLDLEFKGLDIFQCIKEGHAIFNTALVYLTGEISP